MSGPIRTSDIGMNLRTGQIELYVPPVTIIVGEAEAQAAPLTEQTESQHANAAAQRTGNPHTR